MLPQVLIAIDKRVVIRCPLKNFMPRRAYKACPKCEYFNGIAQMSDGEKITWHKKYVIRCAHIIERRTQLIEVLED